MLVVVKKRHCQIHEAIDSFICKSMGLDNISEYMGVDFTRFLFVTCWEFCLGNSPLVHLI